MKSLGIKAEVTVSVCLSKIEVELLTTLLGNAPSATGDPTDVLYHQFAELANEIYRRTS